jgi:hypothetical protein
MLVRWIWGLVLKTLTPRPLPPALVGIARVAVFVAGGRGGWGVVCGGGAGERRSLESLRAFQCHPAGLEGGGEGVRGGWLCGGQLT